MEAVLQENQNERNEKERWADGTRFKGEQELASK